MGLSETLDEYDKTIAAWLELSKKQTAAVQKLQKAIENGNLRDLEKLRQAALNATQRASMQADECAPLEFDAAAYLAANGEFLEELKRAAEKANVRLSERDGILFCYPVLVRREPDIPAVRIDKQLDLNIRPEVLASVLKKLQSKDPKARPLQFIEVLFEGYELVRAKRKLDAYIDLPLSQVYDVLTLLPGSNRDYTLLDFTRDIYFLSISEVQETKNKFRMSLPASTVSRERNAKILPFVTRDGYEEQFASIRFTPPGKEE